MPEKSEKLTKKEEEKKFHIELIERMVALSTSGFGLVAALAWNNVVQEFINQYVKKWLPEGSGFISLLLYAIIITAFAVFITYQLSHLARRFGADVDKK